MPEIRPGGEQCTGYQEYSPSVSEGRYVEDNEGKFNMVFLPDMTGPWCV